MKQVFHDKQVTAALVLPATLFILFAMVVPILVSVYYSLTDWKGIGRFSFIGFSNYIELFTRDRVFWSSLRNVGTLILVTVFLQNPLAFVLAALLTKLSNRFSMLLRTIYFIPAVISVVVIAALWLNLMNPSFGLINKLLEGIGLSRFAVSWLSNPQTTLFAVIFIIVWQGFGWALLFYYTGLMTIPKELEEAARVDGAGILTTYMRIIIPNMLPIISSIVVIAVIASMKQMELVLLTTKGGPGDLSQFPALYLYQRAFVAQRYAYGNTVSVVFVAIAVLMTLFTQRLLATGSDNEI